MTALLRRFVVTTKQTTMRKVQIIQYEDVRLLQQKIDLRAEQLQAERVKKIVEKNPGISPINLYLLSHVKKFGRCWFWTGPDTEKGYGRAYFSGVSMAAHRLSYSTFKGEIGDMHVLHKCNCPRCINPEHLYLGTNLDNVKYRELCGNGAFRKGHLPKNCAITKERASEIKKFLRDNYPDKITLRKTAEIFGVKEQLVRDVQAGRSYINC